MHATYFFLVDVDPDDDAPETSARSTFWEYADEYCDENNWFQEEALLLADRVVPLCTPDDYRGRDAVAAYWDKLPAGNRFGEVRKHALTAFVIDHDLCGLEACYPMLGEPAPEARERRTAFEALELPEMVRTVRLGALDALRTQYTTLYEAALAPAEPTTPGTLPANWVAQYRAPKLARGLYLFDDWDGVPPFAPPIDSPYAHRAYDLRTDRGPWPENDRTIGVLLVDIHT